MSKENFDYDLFDSKIGYDSYNKLYLIRVYDMVKGPNWDRFVSDEDWSWFIMKTGSREYSKVIK